MWIEESSSPHTSAAGYYDGALPMCGMLSPDRALESDPEAAAYLLKYYTSTGVIEDPVVAVHTTYGPCVPPYLANNYDVTATLIRPEAGCLR